MTLLKNTLLCLLVGAVVLLAASRVPLYLYQEEEFKVEESIPEEDTNQAIEEEIDTSTYIDIVIDALNVKNNRNK